MSSKLKKVKITPTLIKWARETAGWTIKEIADKLKITEETFIKFETGERLPTINTLEKLAHYFKRPFSVFLLPSPPFEPEIPADFRVLPNVENKFSKDTLLALRRARRLQNIALEMIENLGNDYRFFDSGISLTDNPETVAKNVRNNLSKSLDEQKKWDSPYRALKEWKKTIENRIFLYFK